MMKKKNVQEVILELTRRTDYHLSIVYGHSRTIRYNLKTEALAYAIGTYGGLVIYKNGNKALQAYRLLVDNDDNITAIEMSVEMFKEEMRKRKFIRTQIPQNFINNEINKEKKKVIGEVSAGRDSYILKRLKNGTLKSYKNYEHLFGRGMGVPLKDFLDAVEKARNPKKIEEWDTTKYELKKLTKSVEEEIKRLVALEEL